MTTWVFGYGSLVWRPDFPFERSADGWVEGWARRSWQGSPDHRGTPDAPGRVVTLVAEPGARTWGRAYLVADDVFEHLDHREQGGYERTEVVVHARGDSELPAVTYIAGPDNPHWLGRAPLGAMVAQIVESRGPSGRNSEYVLRLDEALKDLGGRDPGVAALADAVRRYSLKQQRKRDRRMR